MKTPKGWKQNALPMQLTDIGWEQPDMFNAEKPQPGIDMENINTGATERVIRVDEGLVIRCEAGRITAHQTRPYEDRFFNTPSGIREADGRWFDGTGWNLRGKLGAGYVDKLEGVLRYHGITQ